MKPLKIFLYVVAVLLGIYIILVVLSIYRIKQATTVEGTRALYDSIWMGRKYNGFTMDSGKLSLLKSTKGYGKFLHTKRVDSISEYSEEAIRELEQLLQKDSTK